MIERALRATHLHTCAAPLYPPFDSAGWFHEGTEKRSSVAAGSSGGGLGGAVCLERGGSLPPPPQHVGRPWEPRAHRSPPPSDAKTARRKKGTPRRKKGTPRRTLGLGMSLRAGPGGGGGAGVEREDLSGTVGAAHAPRLLISPSFSRSRLHLRMVWDGTHVPDFAPAYLTKGT